MNEKRFSIKVRDEDADLLLTAKVAQKIKWGKRKMVLITGSRGYIGSRLRENKKIPEGIIEECDLKIGRDILNFETDNKIGIVYHLAAQAGVMPSIDDPVNDARQNILGTIKAIQIANKKNARLIFTTSGAAENPESPYGLSKKTCEEYIKMMCNDYVILRFSSIYGEKEKGVVDNFIRDKKCTIFGDGNATRDFVHVDDIIEALIKANSWEKGMYECGSGKPTKVIEIAKATGKEIVFEDSRTGEKDYAVLRNTTPDWAPEIDVIHYVEQKCK